MCAASATGPPGSARSRCDGRPWAPPGGPVSTSIRPRSRSSAATAPAVARVTRRAVVSAERVGACPVWISVSAAPGRPLPRSPLPGPPRPGPPRAARARLPSGWPGTVNSIRLLSACLSSPYPGFVQLLNKIPLSPTARHDMTRVRAAATAFFAVDGFIFASWAVRIPAVKAAAHASPAALGLALLGVSGGAIATMAISGGLCRRFGSARVIVASGAVLSCALLLPPLARSALGLWLALVVFGVGYGALNVSMNSLAVDLVAALDRPIMPSFHAAWSFGWLAGAALGGLLAPHLAPLPHLALVALAGLTVTAVCGRTLLTHPLPAAGAGQAGAGRTVVGGDGDGVRTDLAGGGTGRPPAARGHAWRVV